VTPSLHIDYKHTKIKQYHKESRALRTETTINDSRDFGIGKRLTNLPALREIGFSANRRLLGAQRLSHNPIRAAEAFTTVHEPITTDAGQRTAGLRLGDRRVHALLQALLIFRLLPAGFRNRDLRQLLGELLGRAPGDISAGQVSYDLRRLRAHGLITRIPRTHRYRLSDTGGDHAMLLTHIHTRLLQPGLTQLIDPDPPATSALRAAAHTYQRALDQLTQQAGFAA
jgi:DNA-binding transcriptional ArsR family regulator